MVIEQQRFIEFLELMCYRNIRLMPNGQWVATAWLFYTTGLFVGLTSEGYATKYCYEKDVDAIHAAETWDGVGDPPGPWIKRKGLGEEDRLGPGARGHENSKSLDM